MPSGPTMTSVPFGGTTVSRGGPMTTWSSPGSSSYGGSGLGLGGASRGARGSSWFGLPVPKPRGTSVPNTRTMSRVYYSPVKVSERGVPKKAIMRSILGIAGRLNPALAAYQFLSMQKELSPDEIAKALTDLGYGTQGGEWTVVKPDVTTTDPSTWSFPGFTMSCPVRAGVLCGTGHYSTFHPGDPGIDVFGCQSGPFPLYDCYNTFQFSQELNPAAFGPVTSFSFVSQVGAINGTLHARWKAPAATVPQLQGVTVPLSWSPEREAERTRLQTPPRVNGKVDVDGRYKAAPYARPATQIEIRIPPRGGRPVDAKTGEPPWKGTVTIRPGVHLDVPDKAKKVRRVPPAVVAALKVFHNATELCDAFHAVAKGMSGVRVHRSSLGKGTAQTEKGCSGDILYVIKNWSKIDDPEVFWRVYNALRDEAMSDRIMATFLGANWRTGVRNFNDQYGSTAWTDLPVQNMLENPGSDLPFQEWLSF